jgi:hypothetical protein
MTRSAVKPSAVEPDFPLPPRENVDVPQPHHRLRELPPEAPRQRGEHCRDPAGDAGGRELLVDLQHGSPREHARVQGVVEAERAERRDEVHGHDRVARLVLRRRAPAPERGQQAGVHGRVGLAGAVVAVEPAHDEPAVAEPHGVRAEQGGEVHHAEAGGAEGRHGVGERRGGARQAHLGGAGHGAVPPPRGHLVPHLPRHRRGVPGGQRHDVGARHDARAGPLDRRLGVVDHVQHPQRQVRRGILLGGVAGRAVDEHGAIASLVGGARNHAHTASDYQNQTEATKMWERAAVQHTYPDEAVVEMQADERGEHGAVVRGAAADGAPDDGLGAGARPRVEVQLHGRGGVHRERQQKQQGTTRRQQGHGLVTTDDGDGRSVAVGRSMYVRSRDRMSAHGSGFRDGFGRVGCTQGRLR